MDSWKEIFKSDFMRGKTFMFECVHPNDPHIISEIPGMYLLGYRNLDWNSKVEYDFMSAWSPPEFWLDTVSKKYSNLDFELNSCDPCMDWNFYMAASNGERTLEKNTPYDDEARDYWGDEEESGYKEDDTPITMQDMISFLERIQNDLFYLDSDSQYDRDKSTARKDIDKMLERLRKQFPAS
jgi:hypothetical protein